MSEGFTYCEPEWVSVPRGWLRALQATMLAQNGEDNDTRYIEKVLNARAGRICDKCRGKGGTHHLDEDQYTQLWEFCPQCKGSGFHHV